MVSRDRGMGAGALGPRNDAIAITDEAGFAALHPPQVMAQAILELGNLDGDRRALTCPHTVINCSHDVAIFQGSRRVLEQAQPPRHALGCDRQAREARAGRVLDGVGDVGGGRADGRLADAARVEGAEPLARATGSPAGAWYTPRWLRGTPTRAHSANKRAMGSVRPSGVVTLPSSMSSSSASPPSRVAATRSSGARSSRAVFSTALPDM